MGFNYRNSIMDALYSMELLTIFRYVNSVFFSTVHFLFAYFEHLIVFCQIFPSFIIFTFSKPFLLNSLTILSLLHFEATKIFKEFRTEV